MSQPAVSMKISGTLVRGVNSTSCRSLNNRIQVNGSQINRTDKLELYRAHIPHALPIAIVVVVMQMNFMT